MGQKDDSLQKIVAGSWQEFLRRKGERRWLHNKQWTRAKQMARLIIDFALPAQKSPASLQKGVA
jgi:hypothetical protein